MANMSPDTTALTIVNVAIAAGGLLCILVVLGAVVYELGWRWRMRRSLPDAWPPSPPRMSGPRAARYGRPAWPALPDAWPPVVEEESKR
jgi:hypothetical protein